MDNAMAILNSLIGGEDGTLDRLGDGLPEHGYFVGGAEPPLVFSGGVTPTAYYDIARFLAQTGSRYVGWWTDPETGKVYVDATTWFHDYSAAEKAARERGEIAFYSIADRRSFRPAGV